VPFLVCLTSSTPNVFRQHANDGSISEALSFLEFDTKNGKEFSFLEEVLVFIS